MTEGKRDRINALHRAFQILEVFNTSASELSFEQISHQTGLGRSAVQRFTHTLRQLGYLRQNPVNKCWLPTHKSVHLAYRYLKENKLVETATPYLIDLAAEVQSMADLVILDDDEALYIMRVANRTENFAFAPLARRWPALTSAPGRAIISKLAAEEQKRLITNGRLVQYTPQTIMERRRIKEIIDQAGRDGFAWQVGETVPDAGIMAAAVLDHTSQPIGAITLGLSAHRLSSPQDRTTLGQKLKSVALSITALNL